MTAPRLFQRLLFAAFLTTAFLTTAAVRISAQAPTNGQLHLAVRNRDTTAVKLLLSGGFNADLKDATGVSPHQRLELFAARSKKDSSNTEIPVRAARLQKSISTGIADIDDIDVQGYTALQLAASFGFDDVAEILIAKGATVNAGGWWGLAGLYEVGEFRNLSTPLGLAAQAGRISTIKLLLLRGAFPNGVNGQANSPLQEAVRARNYNTAKLLIENGAAANAADYVFGMTALHTAITAGNPMIITLLLDNGADMNARTRIISSETPLQAALRTGSIDLVQVMEKHFLANVKDPRDEFARLLQRYRQGPDESLRRLLIQLGGQLQPPPTVPEDARQHFVEGNTIIKQALNPEHTAIAVKSFLAAVEIAPWWGDAYYNLAATYAPMGKFDEAETNFRLYLLSNPGESETRDAKDQIYSVGARRKLVASEESAKAEIAARIAAEDAAKFSWILGDWSFKSGGAYASEPAKTIHFVRRGLFIVDEKRNLGISASIGADGDLKWGRVFDIDECGLKGSWDPLRITFSADRKSAKILFPIVGLKCEIEYSEFLSSGTLRRK